AVAASGDYLMDESNSPAEFPDFPCGAVVPARHTIEILGLLGVPIHNTLNAYSTFVKLIKDREILFDEDRIGIPFRAAFRAVGSEEYRTEFSLIGSGVECYTTMSNAVKSDPLMFDPPLRFVSGEELLVNVTFAIVAPKTIAADTIDLAAIMHVKVE
ncbi:unnamed protein product, partial [marine sediment metagenome]